MAVIMAGMADIIGVAITDMDIIADVATIGDTATGNKTGRPYPTDFADRHLADLTAHELVAIVGHGPGIYARKPQAQSSNTVRRSSASS